MKFREIKNMSEKERKKKLDELKVELMKAKVGNQKTGRTKEIKKIIARILTLNNQKNQTQK